MKREKLKIILLKYYSDVMANMILRGARKPKYEVMLQMHQNHNIPFTVWQDIKSFIQPNNTKQKSSEQELEGVN